MNDDKHPVEADVFNIFDSNAYQEKQLKLFI